MVVSPTQWHTKNLRKVELGSMLQVERVPWATATTSPVVRTACWPSAKSIVTEP
jgi:hypothetical protein